MVEGTTCETNRACDGAGQCVGECNTASDCSGQAPECQMRTCVSGSCGFGALPDGTAAQSQTAGDCKQNVCYGGMASSQALASDVPNDANDCTVDMCHGTTPRHTWAAERTTCNGTGCAI